MTVCRSRQFAIAARDKNPAASAMILLFFVGVALAPAPLCADDSPGAKIYQQKCAGCHGEHGQGTPDNFAQPLVGDRPLADLAKLISETMPEGSPEDCVGEEARQVAAYVYDAFYSPIAQARNRPASIDFSRLTVEQYQNAVADLLGSFSSPGKWTDERGLEAEYFGSRRFRDRDREIKRRDAVVDFNFEAGTPIPQKPEEEAKDKAKQDDDKKDDEEKKNPAEEFSIRWRGAVIAPETGDYEFIVETENGARLWVNDDDVALIDAWVRSGDQTEHKQTIRLLGGRAYPLRLEFFKFKEPTASIRLKWKPPRQAVELIPERLLLPERFPETFVVTTVFPPDDESVGFARGTSLSKAWQEATMLAALEVAGRLVEHLRPQGDPKSDSTERDKRLREFCQKFVERAFRRPLSKAERELYIDRQFEEAASQEAAVKRVAILALASPRFLYREAGLGAFDAYDTASWLSFAMWDSLPDQALLDAAAKDALQTRDQLREHARRMLDDPRTRAKLHGFFHHWLRLEHFQEMAKSSELYPEFTPEIAADLKTSLFLFLDEVFWSDASSFRELLMSETLYLNGRLAEFYGGELPEGKAFQRVSLEPKHRAGLVSHPYLMAGFAYDATSSPIHRGVFLARHLLGRTLRPPPDAVIPLAPELHADLNTRERVALQTSPKSCNVCHEMINPLGFTLEHFDAVGRYRAEEKDRPIDASGGYVTSSGERLTFNGARELATFLTESEEAQAAFVQQLFEAFLKQPIRGFGPDTLPNLHESFAENDYNMQELLIDIVVTSTLKVRDIELERVAEATADAITTDTAD